MDKRSLESDWSTTRYDWREDTLPSTAVVKAAAALTGRTPTALPPLYDHVDPDALDDLVAREDGEAVRVSFTYAGVAVVVTGGGTVAVRPDER